MSSSSSSGYDSEPSSSAVRREPSSGLNSETIEQQLRSVAVSEELEAVGGMAKGLTLENDAAGNHSEENKIRGGGMNAMETSPGIAVEGDEEFVGEAAAELESAPGTVDNRAGESNGSVPEITVAAEEERVLEAGHRSESTAEREAEIYSAGNHMDGSETKSFNREINDLEDSGLAPEIEVAGEDFDRESRAMWRNNSNSELEIERRSSPSSSGYAGERGSSGASSASAESEEDEIHEDNHSQNGVSDSQAAWVPGKRHVDEVLLLALTVIQLYSRSQLKSDCLMTQM